MSLVPKATLPSGSRLPGARHTFPAFPLPQFPQEVRQLPALTFLAAGRLQLQEQPQEKEEEEAAAGRHGGRQGHGLSGRGGAAERGPSSQGAALGHAALPQE